MIFMQYNKISMYIINFFFRATHVPVGQDQAQHIQLAQDLVQIFNRQFGQTFPIPHTLISGKFLN